PERVARTRLTAFMNAVERQFGVAARTYSELYQFSLAQPENFWPLMWEFGDIRGSMGTRIVVDFDRMPGARFFPDATLNFAENLLARKEDGAALIFKGENGQARSMSWAELRAAVAQCAAAFRNQGVGRGDRIAGYLPNLPETVIAALSASAIGAVWSSC